jgi:hypothetical protein
MRRSWSRKRCFPGYASIAAAARCHRDSVNVALKALEDAGLLTWVHRIARIRIRERDLFGQWATRWQTIRTSNSYRLIDPLRWDPGRNGYQSENPPRPQNLDFKPLVGVDNSPSGYGVRLAGARVIQGLLSKQSSGAARGQWEDAGAAATGMLRRHRPPS